MQEIIKIMNSLSTSDILSMIKIKPKKVFIKAHLDKPITINDILVSEELLDENKNKYTALLGNADLEDYFKERYFFENYISASTCGKTARSVVFEDKSKIHFKKIKNVTPYAFIVNMDDKAKCLYEEKNRKFLFEDLYHELDKNNEFTEEEITKISNTISDAFRDVLNIEIEGKKIDLKGRELAIFIDDYSIEKQKACYDKFIESNWKFGEEKDINGEIYAFPSVFNTANDRKPILFENNNMRRGGILIKKEEGIRMMYLFKIGTNNLTLLLNKYNPGMDYSIEIDKKMSITNFSSIKKKERKLPFYNFKINQSIDMDLTPAKELKSQEDIKKLIAGLYYRGVLSKILYTPESNFKMSDIYSYTKTLEDIKIDVNGIQLLYSYREALRDYFNNGEHPERIIKPLAKAMLYSVKKNLFLNNERDFEQERRLDNIINISYYLGNEKIKEEIKAMLNKMDTIRKKLDDFIKKDSEVKEFTIDNNEEFAYYVGQVIQGLISLSQSSNLNGLIASYSELRSNKHIRNTVITLYKRYAYAIKYNSKFNTVVAKVLEYDTNIKSNELWFYYYSGLIGPNRFFYLKDSVKVDNE